MTDQTPTGHTPIDVEPDAWRDRDGILYLNLRKYPNGLNGAYDPDPSATPVFLAARGGNTDNTHVVHVTAMPVAEDVVWCDDCEEWVTAGAPEGADAAPAPTDDQPLHFGYLRECPDGMNCQRHGCLQAHVAAQP